MGRRRRAGGGAGVSAGGAQALRARAVAEVIAGTEPLPICGHVLAGPNDAMARPDGFARLCAMHPGAGVFCPACHEAHCAAEPDHLGTPCDECWDLVATEAQTEAVDLSLRSFVSADGRSGRLNLRRLAVYDLALLCLPCVARIAGSGAGES